MLSRGRVLGRSDGLVGALAISVFVLVGEPDMAGAGVGLRLGIGEPLDVYLLSVALVEEHAWGYVSNVTLLMEEHRLTIANTSRFAKNGSSSHAGVLDVLDVGDDLGALVRHFGLATRNMELKVVVTDLDVGREEAVAIPSRVVARGEPLRELVAGESKDLLVGELGPAADDIFAILERRLR